MDFAAGLIDALGLGTQTYSGYGYGFPKGTGGLVVCQYFI